MVLMLDDPDTVSRYDPSKMLEAVADFPEQVLDCEKYDVDIRKSQYSNLVFLGMGGSASSGDVVHNWLGNRIRIPSLVVRDYSLPGFIDRKSLVIAISYSGNTAETLTAVRDAIRRKARVIGIGTGGSLQSLLFDQSLPFVTVPSTVAPRAALPQLVAAIIYVLGKLDESRKLVAETLETGGELQRLRHRFVTETPTEQNPAKRLANILYHSGFIVTYALEKMSPVARRFKNQLSENSKILSKWAVLPEAAHNEVEAWNTPHMNALPLILRDSTESRKEAHLVKAFESTIKSGSQVDPVNVRIPARNSLARLLAPIFFLDFVSVYLAILRKTDPTPNRMIDQYKKRLKR